MKSILCNYKPILYYPIYREITGSITAGILLSQLIYWFNVKFKFFKTDKELREEIGLSENEFRSAKKKIKNLDFISVKKEGLPAKTWYEIDWEKYQSCLVKFTQSLELKSQIANSEIHPTITENTTENTTNNKKEKLYKKKSWKNLTKIEQENILKKLKVIESSLLPIEDFINSLEAKGYKYLDFVKAYRVWVNREKRKIKKEKEIDPSDPKIIPPLNNLPPKSAYKIEEW